MPKTYGTGRKCEMCSRPLTTYQAHCCSVKCGNDRARQSGGAAYRPRGGTANSRTHRCRICDEPITFDTKAGRLVALDLVSREPHRHGEAS